MERFIGVLIEHFAGAFPLWLAPVQVAVLPISEKSNDYAKQIHQALFTANLRTELDLGSEKVGAKIRNATLQKTPYMVILGDKEQQAQVISLRHRTAGDQGQLPLDQLIKNLTEEVTTRGQSPKP